MSSSLADDLDGTAVSYTATAHPSLALVKYWGKLPGDGKRPEEANLPATTSIAVTLDRLMSRVTVRAAERDLEGLDDRLVALCESDDVAIRVGVCLAAGHRHDDFGAGLLEDLLADPSWEVRAYAAKSLAAQSSQERINSLAWALNDPSFWRRGNGQGGEEEDYEMEAIDTDSVPTADDLCHFDDYLNSAVRWVPHLASRRAHAAQRPTATAGGQSP